MSQLDKAEAQKILDDHNCLRKRHGLQPLTWDWQLAADAQVHADRCIWEHASKIGKAVPGQGENMSLAMGRPVDVQGWIREEPYYNCKAGTCQSGQMCGHWTQMCWHNTTRVGCGKTRCSSLQSAPGFMNADFLVCRYTPQGNYIGRRPMQDRQCDLGATNKTCGNIATTAVESAPASAAPQQQPEPTTTRPEPTTQPQRPERPTPAQSATNAADLFRSEQERIAALQRLQEEQRFRPMQRPTAQPRQRETPINYAPTDTYVPPTSAVPVVDKPESVVPSEQRIENRQNFGIALAVLITLFVVFVLGVLVYFAYRYRAKLSAATGAAKRKIANLRLQERAKKLFR